MPEQTLNVLKSEWYTMRETMERLNLKERTLRTWIQNKWITVKRDPANVQKRLCNANDVENLKAEGPPTKPRKRNEAKPVNPSRTALAVKRRLPLDFTEALKESIKAVFDQVRAERRDEAVQREREQAEAFLTLAESAVVLRLPKAHLYRAVKDGRLPAIKAGGWRIRRSQLAAFQG